MSRIELGDGYSKCKASLKKTSLDENGNAAKCYMTDSDLEVYDFDKVKERYVRSLGLAQMPKSVDALTSSVSGEFCLIEFKNGKLDKDKGEEVRRKAYDSLFILCDLLGIGPVQLRQKAVFVLVYNTEKNSFGGGSAESGTVNSLLRIKSTIGNKANKPFIPRTLSGLVGFCLKDFHLVAQDEFDTKILPCLEK